MTGLGTPATGSTRVALLVERRLSNTASLLFSMVLPV